MIEISWRYDPSSEFVESAVATASEAAATLVAGNLAFGALGAAAGAADRLVIPVTPDDLGMGPVAGAPPRQSPFAAMVGCADARVPIELLTSQSANDVFVVRVAGNVLATECVGSLDYAVDHLDGLRLMAVVGHTGCGAVGAAVDSYLDPASYLGMAHKLALRSIIDAIMVSARGADVVLQEVHGPEVVSRPGYRAALVDVAVVLNAAVAADSLRSTFADRLGDRLGVAFGVYDLVSRRIGLPATADDGAEWEARLTEPPESAGLAALMLEVAASRYVVRQLDTDPGGSH